MPTPWLSWPERLAATRCSATSCASASLLPMARAARRTRSVSWCGGDVRHVVAARLRQPRLAAGPRCYQSPRPAEKCPVGSIRQAACPPVGPIGGVGIGRGGQQLPDGARPGREDAGVDRLGLVEVDRASAGIGDHGAGFVQQQDRGGDVPVMRAPPGQIAVEAAGRDQRQLVGERAQRAEGARSGSATRRSRRRLSKRLATMLAPPARLATALARIGAPLRMAPSPAPASNSSSVAGL